VLSVTVNQPHYSGLQRIDTTRVVVVKNSPTSSRLLGGTSKERVLTFPKLAASPLCVQVAYIGDREDGGVQIANKIGRPCYNHDHKLRDWPTGHKMLWLRDDPHGNLADVERINWVAPSFGNEYSAQCVYRSPTLMSQISHANIIREW